jgi:hypothetical protein
MRRFAVTALLPIAVSVGIGIGCYERFVIPRRPIVWKPCSLADVPRIRSEGDACIIIAGNWTPAGSFTHVRYEIDQPSLRRLVASHGLACWYCDVTTAYRGLPEMEANLGIRGVAAPYVLVFRQGSLHVCDFKEILAGESCVEHVLLNSR